MSGKSKTFQEIAVDVAPVALGEFFEVMFFFLCNLLFFFKSE
jgi:hypothetical protein